MSWIRGWIEWIDAHRDLCFDLVRIYLGVGLFVKGWFFIQHTQVLSELLLNSGRLDVAASLLAHYIPLAHLGGGLLMAIGFLTRVAVLVQIPILFGAVFLVYYKEGLFTQNQGLEFTALVLFLLVVLLIYGSGRFSVDALLGARRKAS